MSDNNINLRVLNGDVLTNNIDVFDLTGVNTFDVTGVNVLGFTAPFIDTLQSDLPGTNRLEFTGNDLTAVNID